jgi:hypothetical protein
MYDDGDSFACKVEDDPIYAENEVVSRGKPTKQGHPERNVILSEVEGRYTTFRLRSM